MLIKRGRVSPRKEAAICILSWDFFSGSTNYYYHHHHHIFCYPIRATTKEKRILSLADTVNMYLKTTQPQLQHAQNNNYNNENTYNILHVTLTIVIGAYSIAASGAAPKASGPRA